MIKLKSLLTEGFREDQQARKFLSAALNNSNIRKGMKNYKYDSYKKMPPNGFKFVNVSIQDLSNNWKDLGTLTIEYKNGWGVKNESKNLNELARPSKAKMNLLHAIIANEGNKSDLYVSMLQAVQDGRRTQIKNVLTYKKVYDKYRNLYNKIK